MLFNKRSVSPLIATILLIVVSVILITVVLTWGSGFAKNNTEKANTFLESSKQIPKSGVFWLDSLIGDKVILKNNLSSSVEIKGYKILTNDFNSDYFWLNSYRPLENNVIFTASSINPLSLVCVPESKFFLELIDVNDQPYSLEINPRGNSSYTKCNTFNVPLWEFETISGNYNIQKISISNQNIIEEPLNLVPWIDGVRVENKTIDSFTTGIGGAGGIYKNNLVVGKRYRLIVAFTTTAPEFMILSQRASPTVENFICDSNGSFEFNSVGTELYLRNINEGTTTITKLELYEIDPLETITDGTNYLENLTAGRKVILSSQAYGSWEFDLYKGNNANPRVHIISDSTSAYNSFQGYMLYIYQDTKVIHFTKSTGSGGSALMVTNSDFVKDLFWYNVKITRDRNNEFTFLIKGPFFTSTPGYDGWTLVSLSSGLNPRVNSNYTNSNYFVIDLGPGDRIANIKISPEIE